MRHASLVNIVGGVFLGTFDTVPSQLVAIILTVNVSINHSATHDDLTVHGRSIASSCRVVSLDGGALYLRRNLHTIGHGDVSGAFGHVSSDTAAVFHNGVGWRRVSAMDKLLKNVLARGPPMR
ncbi:hypothetical protein CBL_03835 [Carabus blaptoides fortunei]